MNFTTPIHISKSDNKIESNSKIMTIGSCFSQQIGTKLTESFFKCLANPFSTVFNPISISELLSRSNKNLLFTEKEVECFDDRHFIYDLHSSYNSTSVEMTLKNANKSVKIVNDFYTKIDTLIITFGSSIGYYNIKQNRLVSNCHKVPNHHFERHFLDDKDMFDSVSKSLDLLLKNRPNLQIILTVSPVRHTKEGLIDNNLSKSKLIILCHKLCAAFKQSSYFPSFEIMNDELRSYRFYKEDMIHPTQQAVDIIWNRFQDTYFGDSGIELVNDLKKLNLSFNHKPFDPNSERHRLFCNKQLEKLKSLSLKYPEIDFSKYRAHFS